MAESLLWQPVCIVIYMKVCEELGLDKEAMSALLYPLIHWAHATLGSANVQDNWAEQRGMIQLPQPSQ